MFLRRTSHAAISDEDLVQRLRGGHQASLAALWDRYAHLLFGVGMKYLKDTDRSKDMVMELFTTLPELIAKSDVRAFRPWVHTVMRNRCLMALRKHDPLVHVDDAQLPENSDDGDATLLREATLQQLEAAIERLKDAQRTCIRLFYLEHLSYQQVAARTGLDLDHVRSHLQNGRRNLRLLLDQADRHDH